MIRLLLIGCLMAAAASAAETFDTIVIYGRTPGCVEKPDPPCPDKTKFCWTNALTCQRIIARMRDGKVVIEPGITPEEVIKQIIEYYQRDMKRRDEELKDLLKLPVRLMPRTGREDKI